MTLEEAIEKYAAVVPEDKGRFLIRLAHELTIHMRDCYDEVDSDLRATKLHGANELQHNLSSEALRHLQQDQNRYPDDVLVRICVEKSAFYGIGAEFRSAFTRCLPRHETR